jgi:hypothetical protein
MLPTNSVAPSASASGNWSAVTPSAHQSSALSKASAGTLVGFIVGSVLFASLIALSIVYWRTRKKAAAKTAENAVLADQISREGFQNRINQLTHGRSSTSLATTRAITTPYQAISDHRYDQPDPPSLPPLLPLPAQYKPAASQDHATPLQREGSTISHATTRVTATPYDTSRVSSQQPEYKAPADSEYEREYDDGRMSAYVALSFLSHPQSTYESEYDLDGVSSYPPSVVQKGRHQKKRM